MGIWGTCRACKAQIIWITTKAGKMMPVNPEVIFYKENPEGKDFLVTPKGATVRCDILTQHDPDCHIGYKSHFATCPQAREFKKKGELAP